MIQKYLLLRGDIYYFRWRVPADLRLIFGATELRQSLHTIDPIQAGVRAGRFVIAVIGIQKARRAYSALEVDFDEYVSISKQYWDSVTSKTIKERLIKCEDFTFEYGDEKEFSAAKTKDLENSQLDSLQISPSNKLFSKLFEEFIAYKKDSKEREKQGDKPEPITAKVEKDHTRYFGNLISIIGDLPIGSICRNTLKEAIFTCRNLPKRNLKIYKSIPIPELLEMDIPEEHRIKDKTVLEIKKTAQGLFSFALYRGYIDVSPANSLKLNLDTSCTFAPYSNDEVREILSASFGEQESWKKWLPALAAYTGSRRGEIVQLRKQDVKFDSDSGRYYLLITGDAGSIKNRNATRQIPLHNFLLDRGFLDFVNEAGDRLFGDLKSESVTQWFVSLRDKLKIEKFDDFGSRKVFHSLRHSFITRSRGAGNPLDQIQQVVGHEKASIGITDRYSHIQPLKIVLDVVDKVGYE